MTNFDPKTTQWVWVEDFKPDQKAKIYKTNILLNDYRRHIRDIMIETSPFAKAEANGFFLGFYDLNTWAEGRDLIVSIDPESRWIPVFESFYGDIWVPLYKVNGVTMNDEELLAKCCSDMDWGEVETITTKKFLEAEGQDKVVVHDLEIEYVLTSLNQYYSKGGVLAKTLRVISSYSDSVIETGTGFGVFSRAFLSGRPKEFITCDPKRWLDSPAKLEKICEQNDIKFEFFHGKSLDYTVREPVDTIFFDGDHTYEYLKKEIKHLSPYAKKFMIFHDVEAQAVGTAINESFTGRGDWRQLIYDPRAGGLLVLVHESQLIN